MNVTIKGTKGKKDLQKDLIVGIYTTKFGRLVSHAPGSELQKGTNWFPNICGANPNVEFMDIDGTTGILGSSGAITGSCLAWPYSFVADVP